MKTKTFSDKQRRVLDFITAYNRVFPYCPTHREIAEKFGDEVGLMSVSVVKYYLLELKARGLVDWVPRRAATIHATEKGKSWANIGWVNIYERELKES